jgi:hypothetical protein
MCFGCFPASGAWPRCTSLAWFPHELLLRPAQPRRRSWASQEKRPDGVAGGRNRRWRPDRCFLYRSRETPLLHTNTVALGAARRGRAAVRRNCRGRGRSRGWGRELVAREQANNWRNGHGRSAQREGRGREWRAERGEETQQDEKHASDGDLSRRVQACSLKTRARRPDGNFTQDPTVEILLAQ